MFAFLKTTFTRRSLSKWKKLLVRLLAMLSCKGQASEKHYRLIKVVLASHPWVSLITLP